MIITLVLQFHVLLIGSISIFVSIMTSLEGDTRQYNKILDSLTQNTKNGVKEVCGAGEKRGQQHLYHMCHSDNISLKKKLPFLQL